MEGLKYLSSLAKWRGSGIFSLDNIRQVCSALDNPQDKITSVHVAGTNGKGSVSAAISSILGAAGHSVLMTTSPHLISVTERVVINGAPISAEFLSDVLIIVRDTSLNLGVELSHFEAITAAAFIAAKRESVDYMVVEVGLGGRLDATNVLVAPAVSCIVSIGLDHQNVLGESISEIAFEKAGIIKSRGHVVVGDMSDEALKTIKSVSNSQEAIAACFGSDYGAKLKANGAVEYWDKSGRRFEFESPLKGDFQVNNMAVAIHACLDLGVDEVSCIEGIRGVRWPARVMRLVSRSGSELIIDSAHNVPGIQALTRYLNDENLSDIPILFGALNTKAWKSMAGLLAPFISDWYPIEVESSEAVKVDEITSVLSGLGISPDSIYTGLSVSDTLSFALGNCRRDKPLLVCGSMYLAGTILRHLGVELPPVWSRIDRSGQEMEV